MLRNAEEYEDLQLQLQRDRSTQRVRNSIEGNAIALNKSTSRRQRFNVPTVTSEDDLEDFEDFEPDKFAEDEFLEDDLDEQSNDPGVVKAYADDELW